MVIESYKEGSVEEIYRRVQDCGRMLPPGLDYIGSWVASDLTKCYQLMRCDDESLFQKWFSRWEDLADFEVIPVMTSEEASKNLIERMGDDDVLSGISKIAIN